MRVLLIGAPSAGQRTQAERLATFLAGTCCVSVLIHGSDDFDSLGTLTWRWSTAT
jgi:hypothetical protein